MIRHNTILFEHVKLIGTPSPIDDGWLLIKENRIFDFGIQEPPLDLKNSAEQIIPGKGNWLLPGFIDLHTHGAYGVDFIGSTVEGLQQVSIFLASHGVTSFLVTTWSASPQEISATIKVVKEIIGREEGASILGIHLEGPFINPTRAGAQSPRDIRAADASEVMGYLDSGLIRLVSLAPEIRENHWLISECAKRRIITSAGHTDATYAEMKEAVSLGISHVTHTYNGMRGFTQREPGALGAALELSELTCEIIADKIHVHPAAIRLLVKAKGLEKVILITDSISGTGIPDGTFFIQDQKVHYANGEARLMDGTLAGSLLTMDKALKNLIEITGIPLTESWVCSSRNAAVELGESKRKGTIRIGLDADLVLLDSNLQVNLTMVHGDIRFLRT